MAVDYMAETATASANSEIREDPKTPLIDSLIRGVAQPGSAPDWGSGGRRFESGRPDRQGIYRYYVNLPIAAKVPATAG